MENTNQEGTPQSTITASQVALMLKQGKDRKQIKAELGLNAAEAKLVFALPGLKGLKSLKGPKAVRFNIVDDIPAKDKSASTTKAETPVSESAATSNTEEAASSEERGW